MATVNFLVKGNENPSTIFLRFKHGRKYDYTKSAGKLIDPQNWSASKKAPHPRTPELKNLSGTLLNLKKKLIDAVNEGSSTEISGLWLEKNILKINKKLNGEETDDSEENEISELITDCIYDIIANSNTRQNARGSLGISKSRIDSYKNLLKIIQTYQGRKKLLVKDVDIKFGRDFLSWMLNERNYSESYAKKKIDDLKTVCLEAQISGINVSNQLRMVKGGKTKNEIVIYLSPDELKKISKITFDSLALE